MLGVIIWIIVVIAGVAIDILTSNFFFVLFSIGAIFAAIASAIGIPFLYQIIIFSVISIISIAVGYPYVKNKYIKMHKRTPLMEETYIGKVMVAKEDILEKAQIKVGGEYWTAVNEGEAICKGESFEITGISGIKLTIIKK